MSQLEGTCPEDCEDMLSTPKCLDGHFVQIVYLLLSHKAQITCGLTPQSLLAAGPPPMLNITVLNLDIPVGSSLRHTETPGASVPIHYLVVLQIPCREVSHVWKSSSPSVQLKTPRNTTMLSPSVIHSRSGHADQPVLCLWGLGPIILMPV